MNRRSFFGFLAAAPVLPLMAHGWDARDLHRGGMVYNRTHLIGERSYDYVMTHSQALRLAKMQFASDRAGGWEWINRDFPNGVA